MNTLTAKEIKEGMTKGEWKPDHDKQPSSIIADEHVCQFYNRDEDDYPNVSFNISAITTAVNGTYGKNLDPEKYEEVAGCLEAAISELQSINSEWGNPIIEKIIQRGNTALDSAHINAKIK